MTSNTTKKPCTHKSWVFTIANYTQTDIDAVKGIPCQRIVAGFEISPQTHMKHIQGAIVMKKTYRRSGMCQALGGRAHVQPMQGTWADQEYCIKDENILRIGDYTKQGKRSDIQSFRDAIKRGCSDIELLENGHLTHIAKFPRLLTFARSAYAREMSKSFRHIRVFVRWGDAGAGKTRYVHDTHGEDVYVFDDYRNGWWDGYNGQKVLLIDEFYGNIAYATFLKLLDGYQIRLNIKGDFTYAQWTTIYITSNKHPREWYTEGFTDAMKRRITHIEHVVK